MYLLQRQRRDLPSSNNFLMVSMQTMTTDLLIVQQSPICFGCIKACNIGGAPVSIILYESLHRRYVDIVPRGGDLVLCRRLHSSVYAPICRVLWEKLCLRKLPIPLDVLQSYFPLFERLKFGI